MEFFALICSLINFRMQISIPFKESSWVREFLIMCLIRIDESPTIVALLIPFDFKSDISIQRACTFAWLFLDTPSPQAYDNSSFPLGSRSTPRTLHPKIWHYWGWFEMLITCHISFAKLPVLAGFGTHFGPIVKLDSWLSKNPLVNPTMTLHVDFFMDFRKNIYFFHWI